MGIWAESFALDGIPCEKFGLMICDFDTNNGKNISTAGSEIELKASRSPMSNKWALYNSFYSSPLEFKITMCKMDKTSIHILEQSAINRWLSSTQNHYRWFQFVQSDYEGIFFKVRCTEINNISISNINYGMEATFICNAPYGYSQKYTTTYNAIQNGTNVTFIDNSDDIGELFPLMTLNIKNDCDLSICNNLTMDIDDKYTWFQIKNCKKGEIITVDCEKEIITTTLPSHEIYNDFGWVWFSFYNDLNTRRNNLTIVGDAEVTFQYRFIRKAGV